MGLLDKLKPSKIEPEIFFNGSKTKIISIMAHKGGVGKSTITVNLSGVLANMGKKVLVMDLDSQNNTGLYFGVRDLSKKIPPMSEILYGNTTPDKARIRVRDNFDLIQGGFGLAKYTMEKGMEDGASLTLRNIITDNKRLFDLYDYVFFDSSPSHSILHMNALFASHTTLVPLLLDFLSVDGVDQIQGTVDMVNMGIRTLREQNPEIEYRDMKIGKIIPNMLDRRMKTRVDNALDAVKKAYPRKLTINPIRICSQLLDCPEKHKLIYEFAPHSTGAEDFKLLAEEVLTLA